MLLNCCNFYPFGKGASENHLEKKEEEFQSDVEDESGSVFGTIRDVPSIYNISRCGPENEKHTKTVDVPSPFKSSIRVDDELEPSRYMFLQFSGIHDSTYIGINQIIFRDVEGNEIPYKNTQVDGYDVDHDTVKPAFPPNGWWAVVGGDHSLLFDFEDVTRVKEIYFWCANAASTPKTMLISDDSSVYVQESDEYSEDLYFQLAGEPGKDPSSVEYDGDKSCEQVIQFLNQNRPENKFDSVVSKDGNSRFVFYEEGKRTLAYDYCFPRAPDIAVDLANNTEVEVGKDIPDVERRAMTLNELRAVRAIIISKCIKEGWRSSYDKRRLRPEDVNLYDLNETMILPLTKKRNCSFKELFSSGTSDPTVYVSHWWGESVLDFIRCCEYHAVQYRLSPDEAKYWVCAYSNRQHDLGTDLGSDPAQSSFNKAMALANGVLLICDMNVVVTTRIWVDFELYRTVAMDAGLDIVIHANGSPHLIAADSLPNESPYQKNKREQAFPFQHICKKMMEVQLHRGDSSMEIDKVRILNTMINHTPLDDNDVLKRAEAQDPKDPRYKEDLKKYSLSDNAVRAEMACKTVSVALSTGQDCTNFYGFDLLKIIGMDALRKTILLNDIVSLDSVTDDIFTTLVKLASKKSVQRFEINAKGCRHLTNGVLQKIKFYDHLKHLSLNLGYARNITNDALKNFTSKIPSSLHTLELDFSGFKNPEGDYNPKRYGDLLKALAKNIPSDLKAFTLVSTLDDEDGGLNSLLKLVGSLSSATSISITFEQWDNFTSEMIVDIAKTLPNTLANFTMYFYVSPNSMGNALNLNCYVLNFMCLTSHL